ncbi:hypothetical protein BJX61DRAFT_452934 [Aspergillus egyptiacus]|nr:hypothetical protein BJX61DRAFT_452934 [Aspergillus egyptiacus]
MLPFKLTLSNNATVAGIHSIPPQAPSNAPSTPHRPLIVALHGGTYDCHYFDGTPECSASVASAAFNIPFISIDRPCYGATSSFLPVPEGSDFNQETGHWLHHYILPALWSNFGRGCNCVVLLCHSLGVMGGIIAAAMHAQDKNPSYPLGGLIASGLGEKPPSSPESTATPPPNMHIRIGPNHLLMPVDIKDQVMFRPGSCSADVLAQSERLNVPIPDAEIQHFQSAWFPTWREKWARHVVVPVMFALVEKDPFFEATRPELESCLAAFRNSVRVDGSLVNGAPHCMELSYWSQGWYARCFGFAMECSASVLIGDRG